MFRNYPLSHCCCCSSTTLSFLIWTSVKAFKLVSQASLHLRLSSLQSSSIPCCRQPESPSCSSNRVNFYPHTIPSSSNSLPLPFHHHTQDFRSWSGFPYPLYCTRALPELSIPARLPKAQWPVFPVIHEGREHACLVKQCITHSLTRYPTHNR